MKNQIIHIIPADANPNSLNGVNKVVDALATEQTRLGYRVMVIGVTGEIQKCHEPIYEYILYKKCRIRLFYPKGLLESLLKNSDEETIFHFHSVFIFWFLPLIKSLKKNDRNHIFLTPHGQYVDEAMKPLKKRIAFSLFDSKILREVEAVQIIGHKTEYNHYIKDNVKRVAIIPNGFGCQNVPAMEKGRCLVFGYLGRLVSRQKGLDILIKAFIQYKKNGGNGVLRLAGSGPDEARLKKMVLDAGMNDYIIFDGVLYDVGKWKFLYNCSAFVHFSRWDVIPTACMEAAYVGCPLLVTDMTNLDDVIRKYNCGSSISELDVNSVQKQLTKFENCYNDEPLYKRLSENSRRMIDEELNWRYITKKIINELYLR